MAGIINNAVVKKIVFLPPAIRIKKVLGILKVAPDNPAMDVRVKSSAFEMNGGKLDADNSMTISGAVTQAGNATIDVKSGKTLTFGAGEIRTESYQLTLEGAGTVAFSASNCAINAVNDVSPSGATQGSQRGQSFTAISDGILTSVEFQNYYATHQSAKNAYLKIREWITDDDYSQAFNGSVLSESGGIVSGPSSSNWQDLTLFEFNDPAELVSGTKYVIEIVGGLPYTAHGNPYSGGKAYETLNPQSSSDFPFITHTCATAATGLVVNNSSGLLKLNGTGTLSAAKVTAASNLGKGLEVNASATISSLTVAADTELNIVNGNTLSGLTKIPANKTLSLIGTGTLGSALKLEGTLVAGANLTVSGAINVADNATVSIPNANTTLTYSGGNLNLGVHTLSIAGAGRFSNSSNSPIVLAVEESILDLKGSGTITGPVKLDGEGSTLKVSGSPTISGNITQSDNATIEVASNQTLSYSGTSLNLGANKLSLTGGGTLSNSNTLILSNADSLLSLEGIGTIGGVRATVNANSGKGIQAVESATLGSFELAATSYLDIAASKTINGPITPDRKSVV